MQYQTLPHPPPTQPEASDARRLPLIRLLQLIAEFIRGNLVLWWRFPRMQRDEKLKEIQRWAKKVMLILGIEVECNNVPPTAFAGLLVSNHLSWLDVLVIQSLMPGVFVAKSEVRHWPLIGSMARACATIFIDRASARSTHAMVDSTIAAFARGYCVVAFPEGTSTDGADLASFHSNVFEGAIRAQVHVQPVTLRYLDTQTGSHSEAAIFIGDTTLLSSLRKVMGTSTIKVKVHIGDCIPSQGQTRRSLCHLTHRLIRAQLVPVRPARHHPGHAGDRAD